MVPLTLRLRHASDRLQKAESANKKLSKKLEQTADLRRQMKALEDENAALVDRNSAMEDDFKRSATLRTLADSYKAQVAELEGRERTRSRELTGASRDRQEIVLSADVDCASSPQSSASRSSRRRRRFSELRTSSRLKGMKQT